MSEKDAYDMDSIHSKESSSNFNGYHDNTSVEWRAIEMRGVRSSEKNCRHRCVEEALGTLKMFSIEE